MLGILDLAQNNLIPIQDSVFSSILSECNDKLPKVPKKKVSKEDNEQKAHLFKQQEATISTNKFDLGLAESFTHKIHPKGNNLVYRKQFKIPETHLMFIEQSLDKWLKLGVVKRANSL
jgi:hypothetical protein